MTGPPVRVWTVSVVVLRGDGAAAQTLLMRRTGSNAGTWCQVAGRIEPGEPAWRAALRELREETGLSPDSLWSADYLERFYEPACEVVSVVPVFVARVPIDAEPVLNDEHDAYRWLPLQDAVDVVSFGGQRDMLAWIGREFVDRAPNPYLRIAT